MGSAGHEGFGHRRWPPALAPPGIELQPVHARFHRETEGGGKLAFFAVDLHHFRDTPGADKAVVEAITPVQGHAGFAFEPIAVITQARIQGQPAAIFVLRVVEQAGDGALAPWGAALCVRQQAQVVGGFNFVGAGLELVLIQLHPVVPGDMPLVAKIEPRAVVPLQAPGVGLKVIGVGADVVTGTWRRQVGGVAAIHLGGDVIELGLEIDQRVVRAVAVVQRDVFGVEIVFAGAYVVGALKVVGDIAPGIVTVGVGFQVAQLHALVVGQVQAELDDLRAGHAAGVADFAVQPVVEGRRGR